jgi:hypothetical protein
MWENEDSKQAQRSMVQNYDMCIRIQHTDVQHVAALQWTEIDAKGLTALTLSITAHSHHSSHSTLIYTHTVIYTNKRNYNADSHSAKGTISA